MTDLDCDFVVLREDNNRYLIEDGTILKVKIVVIKMLKSTELTA